jgi:GAF domain-containing protein
MDKNVIKHLFVKNIGKYFNADRVFFSEYDSSKRMYLPVDQQSEYLSSTEEKSFVGYDWSADSVREYIQPLLEKRELKIFSWEEYIRENQRSQDFISLFVDANVKSSYNFPVLYQERIMGYFCLEFTQHVNKFSNEDINRLRSICTQTGIALYQTELYIKAQESDRTKSEFITNIANMLLEPLNNMVKFSEILPKSELDHEKQVEYLHNISQGGKQLLGLTHELKKLSNASPFQDKP